MALGWNSDSLLCQARPLRAPGVSSLLRLSISGQLSTLVQLALYSQCYHLPLLRFLSAEDTTLKDAAIRTLWQSPGHTSHSAFKSKSWNDVSPQKFWALNQGSVWRWLRAWAGISGRVQSCMTLCMLFILPELLLLYLKNGVKRALSGTYEG